MQYFLFGFNRSRLIIVLVWHIKSRYIWYTIYTSIQKDSGILLYSISQRGKMKKPIHTIETCNQSIAAVRDALYVLNGKWKLPLIVALYGGPRRFKEIQRELKDITPRVLSKELRELEQNEFVTRRVFNTVPVSVIYELTAYSSCLDEIIESLRVFGMHHRDRIIGGHRPSVGNVVQAQD